MSVYAMVWAYEQNVKNSGAKFTLVTAAQYCSDQGVCWVKQETLAEDMGMGVRTVARHLADLEEAKFIERVERRRKDGSRTSDLIKLTGFTNRPNRRVVSQQPAKNDTATGQFGRAINVSKEETYYEELSSSSENARNGSAIPLEKYITDALYDALNGRGVRWARDEYAFHLGRVKDMLRKDSPTDAEIEALPGQLLRTLAFKADADAVHALRDLRRADLRDEAENERKVEREAKRQQLRDEYAGPAPWQEAEGESYYAKRERREKLVAERIKQMEKEDGVAG